MTPEHWKPSVDSLGHDPLFVTVSGAHIYGFPSPDSDVDLRGSHLLPLRDMVRLATPTETIDRTSIEDGVEVDLVSHEIGKFLRLLIKNNGYVLEQIFSPLVVCGQDFLDRLKPIAGRCITRFHFHHYRGFYGTQRKLLEKESVKKAKSLLYAYRVLLTGIHLMESGRIETDIRRLHESAGLDFIPDLIAAKTEEKVGLANLDWQFHGSQLDSLEQKLEASFTNSSLPETRDVEAVDELLIDLRLNPQ
ncbi:nucleotidyltransferase domain-containing protein [Mariniblastus fucicola]|uniref:Putative nucleotidyltransferase n=1 Tax=Mariniblastus fucicola TaxID=980251 RepID=A0A5B9P5Z4_9BACT|nr:nucleotidyltransferase domain-containing protein [Mariniblastus fucicola]QEG21684.1 putative nucleotidyltransferase [Mariniblastus fucicola]